MKMITLQENKKDFLLQWVPFGIIILISFIAYPLTLAIIGGYFLFPLTNLLHKKFKLPVFLSVLLTVILILGSFLVVLFFLIQTFIDLIPFLHEHVVLLPVMELQSHPVFTMFEGKFQTILNKLLNDLLLNVTHLPSYFFEIFLFSIGLFFSLFESIKDREWFLVYFPKKMRTLCHRALLKSSTVVNQFIHVELKLFVLTFIFIAIGFSVLGLHNPIKYAFLISLVDSIPFLGTG
ncbi:AI-2E family transporter, partial [Psychrobacillus psychrotolerans]|uniref:AI-2E family transporter n=1 Tax=Psychrobacillus psychrotolerans TaxID=126156 RepID=UPI003C78FD9C